MSSNPASLALSKARHALNRKMSYAGMLVILALIVGGILVLKFAEAERARDTYYWQVRLGLVADNQKADVEAWLARQFSELTNLSENASLQLYMTELEILGGIGGETVIDPAESVFLRNLLTVTAQRGGFSVNTKTDNIPANVAPPAIGGIALINNEGNILVATSGMPALDGRLNTFLEEMGRGKKAMLDIYEGPTGLPTMAFATPVFSIQGDAVANQQIGTVLGVKPVNKELYQLLDLSHIEHKTAETILVRLGKGAIEYISPLQDGKKALSHQLALNTPNLLATEILERPGAFITKKDYRFKTVLATGRLISSTPWTLIHKVDRDDALADSDARIKRLVGIFILVVLVVIIGLLAAWRHGSSIKSEKVAERYRNLYHRFKSQEHLLRLVSDNQPDSMFIIDENSKFCFANLRAANNAEMSPSDVTNKTLASVLGPHKAAIYEELNIRALHVSAAVTHIHSWQENVIQSKHIPISQIPNLITDEEMKGVLVIEQDITQLVLERERQERTLEQLIEAMVTIVDRHDPYAAHHSLRVAKLSRAIAEEMELDESMVNAAEIAGRLMNMGKILLPPELLTKKDALNEEERKHVHESIYASADFLEEIEFEGPVVETLRQCLEHWDGSGPKNLEGKDILVSARIVAVANTFIAMISPRAYRKKLTQEEVIEYLLGEIGKKYQRSVIVALVNYLENHGGEEDWSDIHTERESAET